MTSISQVSAQPNRWTYGASKGALWTLVRHSALELAKDHGCRINSVSPSWIWTPEVAKVVRSFLTWFIKNHFRLIMRQKRSCKIPLASIITCWDVLAKLMRLLRL